MQCHTHKVPTAGPQTHNTKPQLRQKNVENVKPANYRNNKIHTTALEAELVGFHQTDPPRLKLYEDMAALRRTENGNLEALRVENGDLKALRVENGDLATLRRTENRDMATARRTGTWQP